MIKYVLSLSLDVKDKSHRTGAKRDLVIGDVLCRVYFLKGNYSYLH